MTTPPLDALLAQALGGVYAVQRELGGGGMSRVFLATEQALNRDVVIKVLPPELAAGMSIERFRREIQLAAKLQHPHIVPVLAAGEVNGLPYFTMPYVAGSSLREMMRSGAPVAIPEAVRILRDVASALAHAHAHGVVHRDIKPDNVLLSGGAAMVTDFGIAKAVTTARTRTGEAGDTLTRIGTSLGTPAYMAPEQAAGDPATDHRADLYSLGVMAYEMVSGQPTFAASTPQGLLAAQMSEMPPPLDTRRADVPPALAALVAACLAKDPALRPPDADAVVRALDGVGADGGRRSAPYG
ncbi:MAG: serine/threonine-protein kinase, partial [Gemmatimonadaceae bacterium]